jgi:hypothetical protein
MGRTEAMSVPWATLSEAIQANEQRRVQLKRSIIPTISTEMPVSWLAGWNEDTTFTVADVVSLVVWITDPMYRSANPTLQRIMEKEEAANLLHSSEAEWKRLGGRVRGWVRKHLEEDLRERAAGGDPKADAWELVRTTKRAALLADYMCMARGIRLALWWPSQKTATVLPLSGVPASAGIIHLNCESGHILLNSAGFRSEAVSWPSILTLATGFTWTPPLAAPAIGSQTVAQIQERMDTIDPELSKTGGRAALWSSYLWALCTRSLKGVEDITIAE